MIQKALILLQSLPAGILNHKRRRISRLIHHLAFRHISIEISVRVPSASGLAPSNNLLPVQEIPWTDRQQQVVDAREYPKKYNMVFIDTELEMTAGAHLGETAQGLRFISCPAEGGATQTRCLTYTYPSAARQESAFLPLDSVTEAQEFRPHSWLRERPGMLLCLEPCAETLPAVTGFINAVWPAIFELCPDLVLRIPDGFQPLGLPHTAGVEWVSMDTSGQVEAQIKSAGMAVVPDQSGPDGLDKHALFARHGLPCLCGQKLATALIPPLHFRSAAEAALLAYRLLEDTAYRATNVQRMRDFALAHYSTEKVFGPINHLLNQTGL